MAVWCEDEQSGAVDAVEFAVCIGLFEGDEMPCSDELVLLG
jgi:hypothetical protein